MIKPDEDALQREVGGEYNTFRIYLLMLRTRKSTVREVQRALGFTSPTLAQHHLEKLSRYGLVVKGYDGAYVVVSRSFGILRFYIRSGRWIVPRTIFFGLMFGILALGFAVFVPQYRFSWAFLVVSSIGLVYSIYETVRFYRFLRQ